MNNYTDGDLVEVEVTFDSDGVPIDPAAVVVKYNVAPLPNGTPGTTTTITYAGATTPAPGVVSHAAVGSYLAWLDTTGKPGKWRAEGQSTGTGQATSKATVFKVNPGI